MKSFLLIILLSVTVFSQNINILLFEKQKAISTVTSNTAKDITISKEYYTLNYYLDTSSILYLASLSDQPLQTVGNTSYLNFPLEIKQEMKKLVLGAAYKHYLNDFLYIGPAILYRNINFKTFKDLNMNGTIVSTNQKMSDQDYSLYSILGYQATKSSSILLSLELKNDLFSNEYSKDFTSYQFNASILQWLSQNVQLYFKYTTLLKDKPSSSVDTGLKDANAFSFGIGFQF